MLAKRITSLQHPLVKSCVELRKNSAARKETGQVLLSGKKVIEEYRGPILALFTVNPSPMKGDEVYEVSQEVMDKISGLKEGEEMAALVPLPPFQKMDQKKSVLILDQIQDPGNLGTLLRTALALGWEGVIATPGTVDFFNEKALRAARGATFRLPLGVESADEILSWAPPETLWVADTEGTPLEKAKLTFPLRLILSHEGGGPSRWSEKWGQKISLPMQNGVESLNVSAAGAILLYEMRRKA